MRATGPARRTVLDWPLKQNMIERTTTKLLVMRFSPRSCYFRRVGSYILVTTVLKKTLIDVTDCIILGRYESKLNLLYNLCCRTSKRICEIYS